MSVLILESYLLLGFKCNVWPKIKEDFSPFASLTICSSFSIREEITTNLSQIKNGSSFVTHLIYIKKFQLSIFSRMLQLSEAKKPTYSSHKRSNTCLFMHRLKGEGNSGIKDSKTTNTSWIHRVTNVNLNGSTSRWNLAWTQEAYESTE